MNHIQKYDASETPQTARGDKRRTAILEAATAVFLRDGYNGASVAEIIECSGGSKATLYSYFKNKEGLFGAVIEKQCDHILTLFEDYEDFGETIDEILFEVGYRLSKALNTESNINLFRIIVAESPRFPDLGRLYYQSGPVRGYKMLSHYLGQMLDLSEAEAELAAMQFFDMVKAPLHLQLLIQHKSTVRDQEMRDNVKRAVTTFLNGVGAC